MRGCETAERVENGVRRVIGKMWRNSPVFAFFEIKMRKSASFREN